MLEIKHILAGSEILYGEHDEWVWKDDISGGFLVNSTYTASHLELVGSLSIEIIQSVWSMNVQLKV